VGAWLVGSRVVGNGVVASCCVGDDVVGSVVSVGFFVGTLVKS
jgi:hypothetical protein